MGKILLTCTLALVFGFGGAAGAVTAFGDSLRGPQGETGLAGAPGPAGTDGTDGVDGTGGARGPAGRPGRPGRAAPTTAASPVDLGVTGCTGRAVSVITNVTVTKGSKLQLTREDVCVVD
jgi:hypothetical protein